MTAMHLEEKPVWIDYTNHRGARKWRHIEPRSVYWGATEWHPQKQWLMHAWDWEKMCDRDYAMAGIHGWSETAPTPTEPIQWPDDPMPRFDHNWKTGEAAASQEVRDAWAMRQYLRILAEECIANPANAQKLVMRVIEDLSHQDGPTRSQRLRAAGFIPRVTNRSAGGLMRDPEDKIECHGLDTPENVFFYEQDFYVLSNFSAFDLWHNGVHFPTSEHAYHWEKFVNTSPYTAAAIKGAPSAHEAFKLAELNRDARREDWDDVKVGIMRDILRAKVAQHEYVRRKLLATDDRTLVENSWRDDFWGWGPNKDGQNMLGRLWMEVRDELRAQVD